MSGDASVVLEVKGLTAGYDDIAVVHDVDLSVAAGEVVALLGANGAGKTTTLLAISGLVPNLGGTIEILGRPTHHQRRVTVADVWQLARLGVAHVPEDRGLFFDLTAAENLRLGRPHRGDSVPHDQILAWFPALEKVLDRKAGLLSGRRAADAGAGPSRGRQAQAPAGRRDEPGPGAHHRGAAAADPALDRQTRPAPASCWSNSTSRSSCASPTAPASSARAG